MQMRTRAAWLVVGLLGCWTVGAGCGGSGGTSPTTAINGDRTGTGGTIDNRVHDIPLVTDLQPNTGPIAGGTVVTLTGVNFGLDKNDVRRAYIQVNGEIADASKIEWIDDTHVRFVTPPMPIEKFRVGESTLRATVRVANGYPLTVIYPIGYEVAAYDAQPPFIYTSDAPRQ